MLLISKHILEEAHIILSQDGVELPAQIKCAPVFYVAEGTDNSVMAFGAINHNGKTFKIGTMRFYH
jgi:hypothetical protein